MNKLKHILTLGLVIAYGFSLLCAQTTKKFNLNNYKETIWIQAPRSLYLSGESISVKAQVVEQDSYQLSVLSQYIRLELLNQEGEVLDKKLCRSTDSSISSSLSIPASSLSGWYYIRAYTNWMRNFEPGDFSLMPVKVVNPADETLIVNDSAVQYPVFSSVSFENEVKITVNDEPRERISFTLSALQSQNRPQLTLVIHQSYKSIHQETIDLVDKPFRIVFTRDELPHGLFQISLLDQNKQVISRKLVSAHETIEEIEMGSLPDSSFSIREGIIIKNDLSQWPEQQDFQYLVTWEQPKFLFENRIPGLPGWPANYTIPSDGMEYTNWMSRQAYSDSLVLDLVSENNRQVVFLPETRSKLLQGMVVDSITGGALAEISVGISTLNSQQFNATRSNESGYFYFSFSDDTDPVDYIISFTEQLDNQARIKLIPAFDQRKPVLPRADFSMSTAEMNYLNKLSFNLKITAAYQAPEPLVEIQTADLVDGPYFFQPADYSIVVEDFIKLANVQELLFEVVPNVMVRENRGRKSIQVYLEHPLAKSYETLILLDGIPMIDHNDLLALPPGRIESIDVKNKIYIHGNNIFAAIVNFNSTNKDFAGLELPTSSFISSLVVTEKANSSLPDDAFPESSIPLLEPTLYWNSGASVQEGFEFSTNDLTGTFSIWRYGYSTKGNWQAGRQAFVVTIK